MSVKQTTIDVMPRLDVKTWTGIMLASVSKTGKAMGSPVQSNKKVSFVILITS